MFFVFSNFVCSFAALGITCSKNPASPEEEIVVNPYLGQSSPGLAPELFAPDIFEPTDWGITFSPNGGECFFARKVNNIYTIFITKALDEEWSTPEIASFSGSYVNMEPLMTPGGRKLYFKTTRPLPGASPSGFHQWYSEKNDSGWSEPVPMEYPFNDRYIEHPTVSDNGNIYFARWNDIYVSRIINGEYHEPGIVGSFINNMPNCSHPFIAPGESYLIFSAKPGGNSDLFISFRNEEGNWTRPLNLGDNFNTSDNETMPFVSRDGKYLFFTRTGGSNGGIHWVDAQIIKDLEPDGMGYKY